MHLICSWELCILQHQTALIIILFSKLIIPGIICQSLAISCHTLTFAIGASHNLKSHSTKFGRYLFGHCANTTS